MNLKRALEVFEFNKAMITCDMSISRDPNHQDVSPDYYGKDAEDLYYAIVCVEKYIENSIPIWWIDSYCTDCDIGLRDNKSMFIEKLLKEWKEENV